MESKNWILGCPMPEGGCIAEGVYNAGAMLADDRQGPTPEDSHLQIVSGSRALFEAYRARMKADCGKGWFENTQGLDQVFSFTLEGKQYHVRWADRKQQIRFTEDPVSTPLPDFGGGTPGSGKTMVYQYGLYYDPENHVTDRTVNCGMLYIIHLSDNRLMMIDGGHIFQCSNLAMEGLWQFLREITGAGDEEPVTIALWYFTHAHDDHADGCTKLLSRHHDRILLERVMFNFPSGSDPVASSSIIELKNTIRRWYPEIKLLKMRTGQKFSLAELTVEVLYTQEDAVDIGNMARFPMQDFNCTSGILKLTAGGRDFLVLGDTNVETEAFLAENSEPSLWKADMVQLAHHCFNYLDTLYDWIRAAVVLVPNSYGGAHQPENAPKLVAAEQFVQNGNIYYEGAGTDGLTPTEEGWVHVFRADLVGGEYDGSGF